LSFPNAFIGNPHLLPFSFPDIAEFAYRKWIIKASINLSGVWEELKDFRLNMIFSANYVQSDDFCFFSSRKRRNNIRFCLFFIFVIRGWKPLLQ